jgi:hypothetical protein
MRKTKKINRAIAALLTTAMCMSCLPSNVLAAEQDDISPEALRVSDEFVEKYPNGMLDIVNQNTVTNEDSGEIHFYIARRGGTEGEVDVSLKAIEMTAKYGEDFVFLEDGLFSSHEVEKTTDSLTLLESSLADYGDEPVTVESEDTSNDDEIDIEINDDETDEQQESIIQIDEADTEIQEDVAAEYETSEFDETREYDSSLHQMRDELLNKSTASEVTTTDMTQLFEVNDEEEIQRNEAINTVMPGASIDLHFDDGENYKIVTVKILDDDIVEDDEAFMLGLYDCEGAVLGNNLTSSVCIKDNEEKSEDTNLYFEEENLNVYDQNSAVRLKIARSNNIETYQLLQIQTMGNTAQADKNYSSLITEAVLLAGQEYKYIDIPILNAGIDEPVDFEVRVSGSDCNEATATITIYPNEYAENSAEDDATVEIANSDVSLYANSSQPTEVIRGGNYTGDSYADSGNVFTRGGNGCLQLSSDNHRWGALYYDVDLRGIEKVSVSACGTWANTKKSSRVKHSISIEGGNKTVNKQKNWDEETFMFESTDFAHKKTRLVARAESWKWNNTQLWIYNITLYKQQVVLTFEQPDTFTIPIYEGGDKKKDATYKENGNEKVVAPQSNISALNKNSSRPSKYYRDDTVTLTSTISSDGQKYGAYLKGYELYNQSTGEYKYFDGTELTLTPEIVSSYTRESNNIATLKIKPVYDRKPVDSKLTVGNYATHKGTMTLGGETLSPNTTKDYKYITGYTNVEMWGDWRYEYTYPWMSKEDYDFWDAQENTQLFRKNSETTYGNAQWKVGDYIEVKLNPADGYTAKGINDANGNQISIGTSDTVYVQLKESGNVLVPEFSRNDCGVTFTYEGNTDGLYVFHDKKNNADQAFIDALYSGTNGLKNWTNDEMTSDKKFVSTPVFTGLLNAKIKSNYDVLRKKGSLEGQKLSNLAIGDVVTVYADAPDGYIPYWYIDDGQKTITTENDKIYAKHYGNSFSFEMTSNDITLTCGMEKKKSENYVMTGKLVKPSLTLKGGGYSQVNPGVPASYTAISGAALSTLNFDERNTSAEVDGVTYYSSVTTDSDGNFKMYIPNVSEREYFSVQYENGLQTKATSLLAANGKTYYIVVPANDTNYTVRSINCLTSLGDSAEKNGLIKIPYSSTGANRSFVVNTICSNENYAISNVTLNSYRKDGSLIKSVDMTQTSSSGLEANWRADVNIAEILEEGGRITVEVYDKNGNSRGEVETGYSMEKELQPTNITVSGMPDEFATQTKVDVPVVGNNVPNVPSANFMAQPDESSYEIMIGQGETLRSEIYANLESFNNSDNWSKLSWLAQKIYSDGYSVNASNTESKSGSSTSNFPISFDYGMYMKMDKKDNGELAMDYIFLIVGAQAGVYTTWQWVVYGVPVYVTLTAIVSARGLIGIYGATDDFSTANVKNDAFYALVAKYGQDKIGNKNYSADDEIDQNLFAALYNESNLTADKSQEENVLDKFDNAKKVSTADAINTLLDRYDFYYLNEEIFEKKENNFSQDLKNRISMYKSYVDIVSKSDTPAATSTPTLTPTPTATATQRPDFESNLTISYDETKIAKKWLHRFNLLLLIESLPNYLDDGKKIYNLAEEHKYGDNGSLQTNGIVSIKPTFSVGAGIGKRGTLSVGVSGSIDFVINWEPWTEGRGTVSFSLNADIDLLIIPISIRLCGYTTEMFKTSGYMNNGFDAAEGSDFIWPASLMSVMETNTYSSVNTSPKRVNGNNQLEQTNSVSLMSSDGDGLKYIEDERNYQTETTKHPQPNLYLLPNGNKLIIYMNDNTDRGTYDRNSIYYSVFDKDSETWSASEELEADGTLDGDVETMQLSDGRVVLVWTNSSDTFGDEEKPDVADLMTAQNISLCIFDAQGNPGAIYDITNLEDYGYSEPAVSCNDNVLSIVYKMTDYHTDGVEFDYDNIEGTYQKFMSQSYETLALSEFDLNTNQIVNDNNTAYAAYEASTGTNLNGARFIDTGITGIENPKLYNIKQAVYDGKTYIVYSEDTDNNTSTDTDRELFCIIRENGENSKPIRLTDNNVNDENVNIVVNDMMNRIYFGSGDKICTINLEDITADNRTDKGSYYVMNNATEQTDSVLEYESEEAADSFEIFEGGNGVLYMLWTQFGSSTGDDGEAHKSRALYVKAYDPFFMQSTYTDEETGEETVYTGAWGLATELINKADKYINEPALIVDENDKFTMAYRMFGYDEHTVKNEETGEEITYETESETSTLSVSDFDVKSSISATVESQYPDYPRENEAVTLNIDYLNYGDSPSNKVQFNYYLETDGDIEGYDALNDCTWTKEATGKSIATIKDDVVVEGHMASGGEISDSIQFVMPPYNNEVNLYVTAYEDDLQDGSTTKIPITIEPKFEAYDLKTTLCEDEDAIRIQGTIMNVGNKDADDVKLIIKSDGSYDIGNIFFDNENTEFDENEVNKTIGEIDLSDVKAGESYYLDYSVSIEDMEEADTDENTDEDTAVNTTSFISSYFSSTGRASFNILVEYNDPTGDGTEETSEKVEKTLGRTNVTRADNTIPTLMNISVEIPKSDDEASLMSADDDTLQIAQGEEKELNIKLEPYGSDKGYSIVYESADNSIAEINSSSGVITGVGEGDTVITVKAVKLDKNNIVLVDASGEFRLLDGSIWDFTKDDDTSNGDVVMSKDVNVTVTASEQPTATPKVSSGGGSSRKATPTPLPTSELTETTAPSETPNPSQTANLNDWFVDVPENAWYYNPIKYAFDNGLMVGTSNTEFSPETEITRAMFVTVLYRAENEPDISDEILGYPFSDVASDEWYTDAVYWARLNGIVKGISSEEFAPNDNITREQMAAMISRYASYKGIAVEDTVEIQLDYADTSDISDWAAESVMYCKQLGLMQGRDNNFFAPQDNATRAETAAILQRFLTVQDN